MKNYIDCVKNLGREQFFVRFEIRKELKILEAEIRKLKSNRKTSLSIFPDWGQASHSHLQSKLNSLSFKARRYCVSLTLMNGTDVSKLRRGIHDLPYEKVAEDVIKRFQKKLREKENV